MSRTVAAAMLGVLFSASSVLAAATHRAETFDPGFLDRMAAERNSVPHGPVVQLPPAPQQILHRPRTLLVCMSAPQWSAIYARPDTASPVIGYTLDVVAALQDRAGGFAKVATINGRGVGYVPDALLTPFRPPVPGGTCTVAVRGNGSLVFVRR